MLVPTALITQLKSTDVNGLLS